MVTDISFKERVRRIANEGAIKYKEVFMNYEYLICSEAFADKGYYIIKGEAGNYKHLLGINSILSPIDFFNRCLAGQLRLEDFNFQKNNQSEKDVKGSVRQKIQVLNELFSLFEGELYVQYNYRKNKIECIFATANGICTLGYAVGGRPKTLLKGNELNEEQAHKVDVILRRHRGEKLFHELVQGEKHQLSRYKHIINANSNIILE